MVQKCPYSTRWEKNIVVILYIYGSKSISYYFIINNTLNPSKAKYKTLQLDQYSHRKNTKISMEQQYASYTRRQINIVVILNIYGDKNILILFFVHQDTKYE